MDIKKGTKLKLKWQFLNDGEPVSLSDYSKFIFDVLDGKNVPQRTSVKLAENEVVFSIDTEKYENGRFSVRVDAEGPDGGLHICHRNAFRIVPANAKSSLAKGGPGENYELTIQDDLSGHTQQGIEDKSFVVTFTMDAQENVTSNKTFAEISAKINAGEIVIGYVFRADGMKYEMLPTVKPGESGIVFSSVSYDEENKGIVYQVECHQSEGHDFFEWSVVELVGDGALIVKITPGEQGYSANKTLLQVKDAYSNGIPVVFQVGGENEAEAYWSNMYDAEYFAEGNIVGFYLRRTVRSDSDNHATIQLTWVSNNGQEYFDEYYLTSRTVELTNENTTVEQDPTTGLTKITVANAYIGSIKGSRVLIKDLQGIESSNGLYPSLAHYSSGSIVLYVAYPVTAQMLNGANLMSTFD